MANLPAPQGSTPLPPDPKAPAPKPAEGGFSAAMIASGVAVAGLVTAAAWPGSPAVALLTQLLFPAAAQPRPSVSSVAYSAAPRGAGSVAALNAPPVASGVDSTALLRAGAQAGPAEGNTAEAISAPTPGLDEQKAAQLRSLQQEQAKARPAAAPVPRPQLRGGFRGFSGLGGGGRSSAGQGGAPARAGTGVDGLPPALMAIGMKEMATHPEVIPVLLKLVEYSKVDDQTGGFREAMSHCGSLYKCMPHAKGTSFILSDGLRVDYTYKRDLPFGQRNHFDVKAPTGERAEFSASPLVLDLGGAGLITADHEASFDLDGDGLAERVSALAPGAGVLAFGRASDGRFLFGDHTDLDGDGRSDGYADGFEALAAFVERAASDGVISRGAARSGRLGRRELAALARVYGLRVLVGGLGGAPKTPRAAGVSALILSPEPSVLARDFDGRGNDLSRRAGAVFERGAGGVGEYADVWFKTRTAAPRSAAR